MAHLVRALKFRGERTCGRLLGQLLAAAVIEAAQPLPEALVPIPLHAARYRERGFNQALEIARSTASTLQLPVLSGALVRTLDTREQTTLTLAARRRNVQRAFAIGSLPAARHVALVDDVLTTGSTAREAARVLKAAGVPRVEVWAVARA